MGWQKNWAWIIGVVLLLVGILGFIVESPILGIFGVNTLHNVVHLVTGLVFIFAAWKDIAKPFNQWIGVIYLLVAVLGFFSLLEFLEIAGGNDPDNYLHLGIGLVSAITGWTSS